MLQVFNSSFHTCYNKLGIEWQCEHHLSATCERTCNNLFVVLKQLVSLYLLILVYPTIEDDEQPGKVKWKPGMKKKKSERVDATWNPKGQELSKCLIFSILQFSILKTCNNLVDIIRLVTRLFQKGCDNHDITILLQACVVNFVTFLLYHDCIRLVRTTL